MRLEGNTVLITGGASGIGLALATRLLQAGSTVIVCGRREAQLAQARDENPRLHTIRCDVSDEAERVRLHERVVREFSSLDVLINNAGVQHRPPPLVEPQDWSQHRRELATNLEAPLHLSMLFAPHLATRPEAAIVNVSSGLAFVPIAAMPIYCATKAALHSFTLSLRVQLAGTTVRVIEMIPPAVNTDLGGKGLHDFGVALDEYADHAIAELARGSEEFGYQFSEKGRLASRAELDAQLVALNARFAKR